MSDNKMTNAYALHSEMTDLQRSAHDERQALKVTHCIPRQLSCPVGDNYGVRLSW